MYILFFVVHLFFAYLFYLLGAYFEAAGFVLLWVISLVFFSPFRLSKNSSDTEYAGPNDRVDKVKSTVREAIISFFSKQALFVSIITTYMALIGIVYSGGAYFWIELLTFISWLIFFISGIWLFLVYQSFLWSKIIQKIAETHISILGALLIFWVLLTSESVSLFYSISSVFSAVYLLSFLLRADLNTAKRQIYGIFSWLLIYLVILVWWIYLFGSISLFSAVTLLFIYWIFVFEGVSIQYLKPFREAARAMSLFGLYVATIAYFFLLFHSEWSWASVFTLLVSLAFNVYVHSRFENYPSLVFSTIIPVPLFYFFFGFSETFLGYVVSSAVITLWLTFFWRIIRTSYRGDEYVFQTVAMIVLIMNTISHAWRVWIDGVFQYSLILLLFSLLSFISYLQIRK